jgi:hypothetical protein
MDHTRQSTVLLTTAQMVHASQQAAAKNHLLASMVAMIMVTAITTAKSQVARSLQKSMVAMIMVIATAIAESRTIYCLQTTM